MRCGVVWYEGSSVIGPPCVVVVVVSYTGVVVVSLLFFLCFLLGVTHRGRLGWLGRRE